ncbi:MAG: hypothetical protein JO208_01810 [Alphaproteobacteria bacterium]|nr:hypothetical protein [Alphaproteobacteria bacterium]
MIEFSENSGDSPRYDFGLKDMKNLRIADANGNPVAPQSAPQCLYFFPQFFTAFPNARYNYTYVVHGLDWADNQLLDQLTIATPRAVPFTSAFIGSSRLLPPIPFLPPARNVRPTWKVTIRGVATPLTESSPSAGGYSSFPICSPDGRNCRLKVVAH